MPRPRRYDDDDYGPPPPRRPHHPIGAGIGLGALAGLVGGEGALIFATLDFMKNLMGPAQVLVGWAVCFLVFALAPVFVMLGICGGVATVRSRSTILGIGIGAVAGPILVFVLWACGAISITVNNQPVKFNLNMALWCSALLWIPGAVGALFTGVIVPLGDTAPPPPPSRGRRRIDDDDDDDEEDDRGRRRRRERDDDDDDDRVNRRRRR